MTHLQAIKAKPGMTLHPLGPLVYRIRSDKPVRARWRAAVVAVVCGLILSVAGWVTPAGSGETPSHRIGVGTCTLVVLTGYPCPTCGMTTAFAYTVRGRLRSAFSAQPAGLVLALATIVAEGLSLSVLATGKVWAVNWYRIPPARIPLAILLLILVGWIYKLVAGLISGTLPL